MWGGQRAESIGFNRVNVAKPVGCGERDPLPLRLGPVGRGCVYRSPSQNFCFKIVRFGAFSVVLAVHLYII